MSALLWPVVGYLLGSLAFAVWLPRCVAGVDIREGGSGHAGATNTMRHLGWGWAVAVFALDAAKGFVAVALARQAQAPLWAIALAGAAAVAGHIWPLFAGFRGGMGNATTLGVLLAADGWAALVAIGWLILWVLVWRHAARGTLAAALTAGFVFWALGMDPLPQALAWAVGPVLALRFAQDWHRRYRELWLDRDPQREG